MSNPAEALMETVLPGLTQNNKENNTTMNNNHLGGAFLKTGTLKAEAQCILSARNGGARIVEGKFGPNLELPLTIEDQDFVLSVPADKGDGKTLQTVFGPVGPEWAGKRVRVFESTFLNRVRVQPIG